MERELALEFARVTEAAALSAARWVGLGDKEAADDAAVTAMRVMFDTVSIDGVVVIGEGELDEAPMLYIGERLGLGVPPQVDIAVDPLEGTNIVAKGLTGAISVLASAPRGTLLHAPDMYMDKIAVGPECKGRVFLDAPVKENLRQVAKALDKSVHEVTAVVLDRERHQEIIEDIRSVGARIKLISDGDVSPAVAAAYEDSGVDILLGIGGAPEGVITAAALKCLGGDFQARLCPGSDEEIRRCHKMGIKDTSQLFAIDELVKSDDVIFVATGITDSFLLKGVTYLKGRAITRTLVMRSTSGTIRLIEANHNLNKKPLFKDKRIKMIMTENP
ncbi:Fructose-1,6-bisphosphatase class 2/Sedoheputulose-1,7-bisphosphatase [Syntrophomonas zehnderi OL-4]|uniref:Fructose-1,6-bisphosphatase n=1 Tax=Syntrophomonas zehnderi OL-4 TaxID=690567 RepID=A0A0E4G901_9FIRM|nr:class II fructose-bisphosphatase [Syntrophomonas zehnderi]CFX02412.1 Fructose-1,6-bisphosphatase class 2/Sedoheputulose-1,7-bisphosphatase [Syntrophomonas zehnderi OL-4]